MIGATRSVGNLQLAYRLAHRRRGYRELQLFAPAVQRSLRRHGYCITDEVVPAAAIGQLWTIYERVASAVADLDPERFTPIDPRRLGPEVEALLASVDAVLRPTLKRLTTDRVRISPSVFQSKPSSEQSAVDPHQDSMLVDEQRAFGAYAWVPLQDVDIHNGAMYMVPGSHRFGAWNRAPATGAELEHLRPVIWRHARVLPARAGQVILFDHAVMHGSVTNRSGERRVAAGAVIRPIDADVLAPTVDESTPPGRIDIYRYRAADNRLTDAEMRSQRVHVGTVAKVELTAGPRSFGAVCVVDALLHPGAGGDRTPSHDRSTVRPGSRRQGRVAG